MPFALQGSLLAILCCGFNLTEKAPSSLTPLFPSFPFLSSQLKNKHGLWGNLFLFHYERGGVDGVPDSKSGFGCLELDQRHLEGEKIKKEKRKGVSLRALGISHPQ